MEIYERIRILRKENLHMSQTEFGEQLGVSRSVIANIELNTLAKPEQKEPIYKLICKTFNVNYLWLTTGEGEMFDKEEDSSVMGFIDTILSGENETAISIFKTFSKFSTGDWKALQRMIDLYNSVNDKKEDEH